MASAAVSVRRRKRSVRSLSALLLVVVVVVVVGVALVSSGRAASRPSFLFPLILFSSPPRCCLRVHLHLCCSANPDPFPSFRSSRLVCLCVSSTRGSAAQPCGAAVMTLQQRQQQWRGIRERREASERTNGQQHGERATRTARQCSAVQCNGASRCSVQSLWRSVRLPLPLLLLRSTPRAERSHAQPMASALLTHAVCQCMHRPRQADRCWAGVFAGLSLSPPVHS